MSTKTPEEKSFRNLFEIGFFTWVEALNLCYSSFLPISHNKKIKESKVASSSLKKLNKRQKKVINNWT
jgi:hypothetical protein